MPTSIEVENVIHKLHNSMNSSSSDYEEQELINIFCGTWNVNSRTSDEDISGWLIPENFKQLADIYAVAFQEIVDLNPYNVAFDDSMSSARSDYWIFKVGSVLNKTHFTFSLIQETRMVGILLVVFVRDFLIPVVSDIRGAVVGTGFMGFYGNKGGVAIRLNINESSICFVSSHLAASRNNVKGRHRDYFQIIEELIFAPVKVPLSRLASAVNSKNCYQGRPWCAAEKNLEKSLSLLQHDIIFWIGDVNYRIDKSINIEEIYSRIHENDYAYLLERDQLNIERLNQRVFVGFRESAITFPPTYKFQRGCNLYERRQGKKQRAPAWCDRVLWGGNHAEGDVRPVYYGRAGTNVLAKYSTSSVLAKYFIIT